ncbi:MAG: hypothetical protein V4484_03295 [Pseudomonadota bacterium]
MTVLTFETREVVLTLDQHGAANGAPVISFKLRLSSTPSVYVSNGDTLQHANWTMQLRRQVDGAREADSLTYSRSDGKSECQLRIHQSPGRFRSLLDMLKGGHASEITVVTDGMEHQDDYSSRWDTDRVPVVNVLRVSFEFPLPQCDA